MKFEINNNSPLIAEENFKTSVRTDKLLVHYPNPRISELIKEIGERERLNKIARARKHSIEKREADKEENTTTFRVKLINLRTKT
jgi:hypothetical protein